MPSSRVGKLATPIGRCLVDSQKCQKLPLGFDLSVMTETLSSNFKIEQYLAEPLVVGEPDTAGPLAVFPLFGAEPKERYVSFAEGRSLGVKLGELGGGASVRDLVVDNPTDVG